MAPRRALAVATEAGKVKFWTHSASAGCMLYLYGKSGTTYLYIHLNNDLTNGNDNRGKCVAGTSYAPSLKDGQKVQAEKRVLPGYVLVNMDLDDDAWSVVKNTPGVTGFVGAAGKPIPLSQPEVDRILRTGVSTAERARAQVEYSLGESVKVTSGPLSDFDGEIVDVQPDAQKLKVLVDIFERQVPVELGFDQVKKID